MCELRDWFQELNEEDKQSWNKKASEFMEAYKKEMEEYNKSAKDIMPNKEQEWRVVQFEALLLNDVQVGLLNICRICFLICWSLSLNFRFRIIFLAFSLEFWMLSWASVVGKINVHFFHLSNSNEIFHFFMQIILRGQFFSFNTCQILCNCA